MSELGLGRVKTLTAVGLAIRASRVESRFAPRSGDGHRLVLSRLVGNDAIIPPRVLSCTDNFPLRL